MAKSGSNQPAEAVEQSRLQNYNYITTNRFYVEIENDLKASFTECTGLDVQIDKDVLLEGGVNEQQRILLKQIKFNDITLKRGMTDDVTFWNWIDQVIETGLALRRNITILLFNQAGETMQSWQLIGAVPVAWKTPGFQADASAVAIEELTLAYEGLKLNREVGAQSKQSAPTSGKRIERGTKGYFD